MGFYSTTQQFNNKVTGDWGTDWLSNIAGNRFDFKNLSNNAFNTWQPVARAPVQNMPAMQSKTTAGLFPKALDTKTLAAQPQGGSAGLKKPFDFKGIGNVAGAIDSILPDKADNELTSGLNTGYDAAANALMAIPGWGTIAGGAMKVAGLLGQGVDAITGGIDNATNTSDKILSSKFFNWNIGALNSATKKTVEGSNTDLANTITRGYQPTDEVATTDIGGVTNKFKKMFGKGMFNKNKKPVDLVAGRQASVDNVNRQNALKSQSGYMAGKNELASTNATADIFRKNRQTLEGGQDTRAIAAKSGAKLLDLKNIKAKANRNIKLKQGGIIPQNLIPSGQFHSRNHGIEVTGDISKKGIPVISMEDGGEIKQHAEIEVNEIIFHKQLTESIEKLYKEYENGNNEAALEAGKLLVYEILENTQDNTGIIKTI